MSRLTAQHDAGPTVATHAAFPRGNEGEQQQQHRHAAPLRLLQPSAGTACAPGDADPASTLPTLATAADVREAVQYLKKKPAGVPLIEALDNFRRRVFEPRKVAAYECWGLVARRQGRLFLTPHGWEFARRLEPEAEGFGALLERVPAYRAALAWIDRERLILVTQTDVEAFWRQLDGDEPPPGSVLSFFHLCQAAGLGTAIIGKRGLPSRLRVERGDEPSAPPAHEDEAGAVRG